LITLNDQRPIWLDEPLTGFSVVTSNTSCIGQEGEIQITTNGTPAFTWELDTSGAQGTVNPTGSAPFTFTITAPVGIDTLIVTDSLGRVATVQVDVPASTAAPVNSTSTHVDPTICTETTNSGYQTIVTALPDAGDTLDVCAFLKFDQNIQNTLSPGWDGNGTMSLLSSPVWNGMSSIDMLLSYNVELKMTAALPSGTSWSEFFPGMAQSGGLRVPVIIAASNVTGWPTTTPAIGVPFTVTVTNAPFTMTPTNEVRTDVVILRNSLYCGGPGGGFNLPLEMTGNGTGIVITANNVITSCNGSINTTPTGGAGGPYTVIWNDGVTAEDRTNLCPGNYQYYSEDVNGCQSDVYSVDLTCATVTYNYVLREYLNNCTQISSATYIASSASQLPIGQVCTLQQRQGCYYIESVTQNNAQYDIDVLSVDCAACNGGEVALSYQVETCGTGANTYYVSRTGATLSPGMSVELNNQTGCFLVIGDSTIAPGSDASMVYKDCAGCASTSVYYYKFLSCDGLFDGPIESPVQLSIGSIIDITPGPGCGTIYAEESAPGTYTYTGSLLYEDCNACNGITPPSQVCHAITNTGFGTAQGTYTFNGLGYGWTVNSGNTISICAVTGSVTVTSGQAGIYPSTNPCTSPKNCTLDAPTYVIESCIAAMGNWTLLRGQSNFQVGDVVQFRLNTGLAVYCGTIITLNNGNPDAILHNEDNSYGCEDSIHCLQ
jgi:hypothetical protein